METTNAPFERRFTNEIEIRQDAGRPPRVTGYAAVWDVWSHDLGGFREIVRRGAFTRSLAPGGNDVVALQQHEQGRPVARRSIGTLRLHEDSHGLAVDFEPLDTSAGRDMLTEIRSGVVGSFSFGFKPAENGSRWNFDTDPAERELLDLDLFEVSPATIPAFDGTIAEVRSLALAQQVRQADNAPTALAHRLAWMKRRARLHQLTK